MRLVQSGDRGVLIVLERELPAARPGTADLLRAMAVATPPPDHFARTLVVAADAPTAETVAAAYELMAKLDTPADLEHLGAGGGARACRSAAAGRCRASVAQRRRQDGARDARARAPRRKQRARSRARERARGARRCERRHARAARGGSCRRQAGSAAGVSDRCSRASRAGPVFDEAARALRFTERDFSRTAAMYLEALKRNRDLAAQAALLDYIAQAHSEAGPLADALRPYANASDPKVRQAAIAALDSIKPSWRESGERAAAVAARRAAETGVAAGRRERRRPPEVLRRAEGRRPRGDRATRQRRERESADGHAQRHASLRRRRSAERCSIAACRRSRRQRVAVGRRAARGTRRRPRAALAQRIDGARLREGRVSGRGAAGAARPAGGAVTLSAFARDDAAIAPCRCRA